MFESLEVSSRNIGTETGGNTSLAHRFGITNSGDPTVLYLTRPQEEEEEEEEREAT